MTSRSQDQKISKSRFWDKKPLNSEWKTKAPTKSRSQDILPEDEKLGHRETETTKPCHQEIKIFLRTQSHHIEKQRI